MKKNYYDNWWNKAFVQGHYPLTELTSDKDWQAKTRQQVNFLIKTLKLPPGAHILDLACGAGRHSIPLAQEGYQVTGVDISPVYLAQARRSSVNLKNPVTWVRQDMRRINFNNAFEAVINLFTSFGYFPNAGDDLLVLRKIHSALKKGGFFFIDTFDRRQLSTIFHPQSWIELPNGSLILEERQINKSQNAIFTRWIFLIKNKPRRDMRSFIRLYTRKSLTQLLRQADFRVLKVWPATAQTTQTPGRAPRLVILAQKP